MKKPKLLIIYHIIPETVVQLVVSEFDEKYDVWERAHGHFINLDEEIPDDVHELLSNVEGDNPEKNPPLELSGDFKVIHCGFLM